MKTATTTSSKGNFYNNTNINFVKGVQSFRNSNGLTYNSSNTFISRVLTYFNIQKSTTIILINEDP